MSRINIISKQVNGEAATQLDLRVINVPLYPDFNSSVEMFYGYYKSGSLRIEGAEGNITLDGLISDDSKNAILTALAIENLQKATLSFHQLGGDYVVKFSQTDGTEGVVKLSGTYFTTNEENSIKSECLTELSATEEEVHIKSITVNSTEAQTGYPIYLKVNSGTGTDSVSEIFLNGKVREDWGDIRILTNSLERIPFAIVSKESTSITIVFSATLISGDTDFYIYYNKPEVVGSVTKFGVTTDQHYDSAETYVGRDHALARLDNFATRMAAYSPDAILEGGDKIGSVTTDSTLRLAIMNSVTAKHSNAATAIGCAHYLWGWGNHDFEQVTFVNVQANYSSLPGLVAGTLYGKWEDEKYCYISLDSEYNPSTQAHLNLNQGYGYVNTAQLTWLTSALAAATKPCIVFCHQLLCEADTERIYLTKETYHVQNRTAIRAIFENSGKVLFVLQGHTHMTSHNVINGIPYLNLCDVNEPPASTYGWDTPTPPNFNGRWGIIEVDRSTMMIKFRQETQIDTTVQTVYEFMIPYRTIYDEDYGSNPEKVFALGNSGLYDKASIISDATDMYVNNDLWVIAKPASIYDSDPRLSDRTMKIYGITSSPSFGRVRFDFAPQSSGKFRCMFSANLSAAALKYIKLQKSGTTNVGVYIGFMANGNINILDGATSTVVQTYAVGTWYNFIVTVNMDTQKLDVVINGTEVASQFDFNSASATLLDELEVVTEAGNMFLDFFRIEKYISPAPSITSIGTEENL